MSSAAYEAEYQLRMKRESAKKQKQRMDAISLSSTHHIPTPETPEEKLIPAPASSTRQKQRASLNNNSKRTHDQLDDNPFLSAPTPQAQLNKYSLKSPEHFVHPTSRFLPIIDRHDGARASERFEMHAPPTVEPEKSGEPEKSVADKIFVKVLKNEMFGANNEEFSEPQSNILTSPPRANPLSPPTPKRLFRFQSPESHRRSHTKDLGSHNSANSRMIDYARCKFLPQGKSLLSPESKAIVYAKQPTQRIIPMVPYKVLDAPDLQDDFYLNLVDWGSRNILGVGLASCVYLWSAQSSTVTKLCDLADSSDSITSVNWNPEGTTLAVGTNKGIAQLYDAHTSSKVREFKGHNARVGSLSWGGDNILTSGSRDRMIFHHDLRVREDVVMKLDGHKQEVCGLKWNYDYKSLASGGNDNKLLIWDARKSTKPIIRFSAHEAAVKAIAWSPIQNGLLASGGGTADRHIRFWNTISQTNISSHDTGSQVCNLFWSKHTNELVSTHGYSQNQIVVWKYPKMTPLATLTGHTLRVLYLAMSPDGTSIVTGAGDETLRFWNVFNKGKSEKSSSGKLENLNTMR